MIQENFIIYISSNVETVNGISKSHRSVVSLFLWKNTLKSKLIKGPCLWGRAHYLLGNLSSNDFQLTYSIDR